MKKFVITDCIYLEKLGMTKKEFEVLEDVLSEISEYRVYEGEDEKALNSLKEYFSFSNYEQLEEIINEIK